MTSWPAIDVDLPTVADGDLLQAALTDYAVAAIHETRTDSWRVFFHTGAERDRARALLAADFPYANVRAVDVADEDWAARSQAGLRAVRVGSILVAPPWDVPVTVVIRPSAGFGTGHHATTRLCLAALQRIDLRDRSVLDVGTGSGVLAIAASRLGAREVTGIDDDPDALGAASGNLVLNPGAAVTLVAGDVRSADLAPADVVVANLTGALLVATARRLRQLTAAGGRLILSGFMAAEETEVVAAHPDRSIEHRAEGDQWLCVTLK